MAEVLIDTNILIYAHQSALAEFFSATTRGQRPILTIEESVAQASLLAEAIPVLDVTGLIVLEAGRGVRQHGLSYFDAQIWATARLNQIPTIFTEDFVNGRRIEGVQFLNPLTRGFDLGPWSL